MKKLCSDPDLAPLGVYACNLMQPAPAAEAAMQARR